MDQYRVFIKDCLNLKGRPKAELKCLSFDISRDLMEKASATFTVTELVDSINEGDVIALVDPYGDIPYYGTITSFGGVQIQSDQIESLFDDNWLYHVPDTSTIESAIRYIILNDFTRNADPVMQAKYNFEVTAATRTEGKLPVLDDNEVMNFEDFLYQMFNDYGIVLDFDIPFEAGTPKITISRKSLGTMKVANNTNSIMNLTVETEVVDTNKLIVYSEDGSTLRGTYYVDANGITTNARSGTRLPVIDTDYVFSDDELDTIVKESLNAKMYNHFISFEVLLNSELYKNAWYTWKLSQPIDVWNNGDYYNSIYTGFNLKWDSSRPTATVLIKCGKVRANLTSRILSIFGRQVKSKAGKAIPLDWIDRLFEE